MQKRIIFLFIALSFIVLPLDIRLSAQETIIADIFRKQADSIVVVGAVGKRKKDNRSGSGFIVSEDGLIITNYHLIKKARRIFVKLRDNTAYSKVKVMNVDASHDIAVLKVDDKRFRPVKLGNSAGVTTGQRVVAIGNPLGLESTISDGLISAVRSDDHGGQILQISVPLSNGSSGSPLFNLNGEVIGIVTASLQNGQSLNFAVPINEVKPRLRRFMALEEEPAEPAAPAKAQVVRRISNPSPSAKEVSAPPYRIYVIQKNDTLWGLAKKFDTTIDAIMKFNQMETSTIITGQKIKIPD